MRGAACRRSMAAHPLASVACGGVRGHGGPRAAAPPENPMRELTPEDLAAIAGGQLPVRPLEGWPMPHEVPPDQTRELGDPVAAGLGG